MLIEINKRSLERFPEQFSNLVSDALIERGGRTFIESEKLEEIKGRQPIEVWKRGVDPKSSEEDILIEPLTPAKVAHGIVGLAKSALGISLCPDEVIYQRRSKCAPCEYSTKNEKKINTPTKGLTTFSRCTLCRCNIASKTRLAKEECPIKLWLSWVQ